MPQGPRGCQRLQGCHRLQRCHRLQGCHRNSSRIDIRTPWLPQGHQGFHKVCMVKRTPWLPQGLQGCHKDSQVLTMIPRLSQGLQGCQKDSKVVTRSPRLSQGLRDYMVATRTPLGLPQGLQCYHKPNYYFF